MKTITFNKELHLELKFKYRQALLQKKQSFMFHGNEILTAYAKYMIEYLNLKLK